MIKYSNFIKCSNGIFDYLWDEETSTTIYHYTSPEGFLSIIKNGTLRFTDRLCLNDASEGVYILDLIAANFDEIIESQHPLFSLKDNIITYCNIYKNKISEQPFKIYQISFSCDEDSLCMWNYYTKGNDIRGYNIRFNSFDLCQKLILNTKDVSKTPHIFKHKVIYDHNEQVKETRKFFQKFYEAILECYDQSEEIALKEFNKRFKSSIVQRLTLLGTFFKSHHFSIENEYRIALDLFINENGESPNLDAERQYTYKKDIFVPYYDIKFKLDAIKSITLSPTIHYSETANSIKSMLREKGLQNVQINKSGIPVRF